MFCVWKHIQGNFFTEIHFGDIYKPATTIIFPETVSKGYLEPWKL